MAKITHHVIPNSNGGWDVKRGGAQRASVHTDTKAEAIKVGRVISQRAGSEFVIHRADGRIQRSDSCGSAPYPARVKELGWYYE